MTHALQSLPACDRVYVVQDGRIVESGSYPDLVERSGGVLRRILQETGSRTGNGALAGAALLAAPEETAPATTTVPLAVAAPRDAVVTSAPAPKLGSTDTLLAGSSGSRLIMKETTERGNVSMHVYKSYLGAMGRGPVIAELLALVLSQAAQIGSSLWLAYWSSQDSNNRIGLYLGVYAALGVAQSALQVLQSIFAIIYCGITYALGAVAHRTGSVDPAGSLTPRPHPRLCRSAAMGVSLRAPVRPTTCMQRCFGACCARP